MMENKIMFIFVFYLELIILAEKIKYYSKL